METLLLQRYNTEIAIAQYDNVTNRCCDQDMRAGRRNREGQGGQGSLRLKPLVPEYGGLTVFPHFKNLIC